MTQEMQTPHQMLTQALSERLPAETVTALMAYPEMAADLVSLLEAPPLAADYVPRQIEVLFDDVTVLQWQDGQIQSHCPDVAADYQPERMEWLLDGETAYFSIQGLEVINRLTSLPILALHILEPFKEDLCKPQSIPVKPNKLNRTMPTLR